MLMVSIYSLVGMICIPAIFFLSLSFVRSSWPFWLLLIVVILVAWDIDATLSWRIFDPEPHPLQEFERVTRTFV